MKTNLYQAPDLCSVNKGWLVWNIVCILKIYEMKQKFAGPPCVEAFRASSGPYSLLPDSVQNQLEDAYTNFCLVLSPRGYKR